MSRIPSTLAQAAAILALVANAGVATAQPFPAPAAPATAAAPAPAGPAALAPVTDASYVLGMGDGIEVTLIGRADYDAKARVQSDGMVLLPLIGALPASGLTPTQLANSVQTALVRGGFFPTAQVHVEVAQVSSRYATVLGAVTQPGLVPLDRDYRLSEMLARVGGKTSGGADFAVLTKPDGTSRRYKFADLATGGRDQDPPIQQGDKVFVPAVENEVVYVTGQVRTPGAQPIAPDMTVRMALARAGGVNDNGSERRVKLVRKGVQLRDVQIDVTRVEPGDVITVGERLF